MEGHCSTGQSPQWALVPMEEDEEEEEVNKDDVRVYRRLILYSVLLNSKRK